MGPGRPAGASVQGSFTIRRARTNCVAVAVRKDGFVCLGRVDVALI